MKNRIIIRKSEKKIAEFFHTRKIIFDDRFIGLLLLYYRYQRRHFWSYSCNWLILCCPLVAIIAVCFPHCFQKGTFGFLSFFSFLLQSKFRNHTIRSVQCISKSVVIQKFFILIMDYFYLNFTYCNLTDWVLRSLFTYFFFFLIKLQHSLDLFLYIKK